MAGLRAARLAGASCPKNRAEVGGDGTAMRAAVMRHAGSGRGPAAAELNVLRIH